MRSLEFETEREALEAGIELQYTSIRKPIKCYDMSINWIGFSTAEAVKKIAAWDKLNKEEIIF